MSRDKVVRQRPRQLSSLDWSEGMLLEPHHFDHIEARSAKLLHYRLEVTFTDCWGITILDPMPKAVTDVGKYRVNRVEAVFPDGTAVAYDNEREPLTVDLEVEGEGEVYLILDYEREVEEGEEELVFRSPRVRLFHAYGDARPPASSQVLRVANLAASHDEKGWHRDPPMLRLLPNGYSHERLEQLCKLLLEKELRARKEYGELTRTNKLDRAAARRVDLQDLAVTRLRLRDAIDRQAHPRELHGYLLDARARLSAMDSRAPLATGVPYDHEDPFKSIVELCTKIQELLELAMPDEFKRFFFKRGKSPRFRANEGGEAFSLEFDPDWADRTLVLAARGARGVLSSRVFEWVDRAKICGEKMLYESRANRRLGLRRTATSTSARASDVDSFRSALTPEREDIVKGFEWIAEEGMIGFVLEYDEGLLREGETLYVLNAVTNEAIAMPEELVLYVNYPKSEEGEG